uniref:Uncharacterized protein n=1 Tax=Anopheles maculatus TaxID=74869 RepID=A0A182SJ80_9DIPT
MDVHVRKEPLTNAGPEQQQQQHNQSIVGTCCTVPPNNRSKFMSTTRCDGYVGSRIASRYDEDEEEGDDGGGEEVDPDGTIPEEDEELEEQESNTANDDHTGWHHRKRSPTVTAIREEFRGSVSQNRTRANRYRRAFGGRCPTGWYHHVDAI